MTGEENMTVKPQDTIRGKIWMHAKTAAVISLFLIAFFNVDHPYLRQLLLYFLISAGLFFSFKFPLSSVLVNTIGLLLLFLTVTGKTYWPVYIGISLMMVITMVIPLYFDRIGRLEREASDKQFNPLEQRLKILQIKGSKLETDRMELEREIEKINQLYVLGRELVEHMELSEVADHLKRCLMMRPGINSVAMFLWDKSVWTPLFFSKEDNNDRWIEYVKRQDLLFKEKNFKILHTPVWLKNQAVVYWPVKLDRNLLAGIFITTEPALAEGYLDEGRIFIPQIALGLKRTDLFAEVQERSREDGLTGLYLRRYFIERLQAEIQRAKRYTTVFSLLMMDIDDFKKVNDTYGHLTGDAVLSELARIFLKCTRPGDLVCRYGGEEFAILLPLVSREETLEIAERIRKTVAETQLHSFSEEKTKFGITISIGISYYPANETALIPAADKALYWVKANKKNGVKEYGGIKK
ncbi:MAG: GGDEF domain-containing protein [Elusimicrobiota bacterium]